MAWVKIGASDALREVGGPGPDDDGDKGDGDEDD